MLSKNPLRRCESHFWRLYGPPGEDAHQCGNPKKYGKFKHQSICYFTYLHWRITIHPDLLMWINRGKYDYELFQILFEGAGFCFTLGDSIPARPKSRYVGLTWQAPIILWPEHQFENWQRHGPWLGNNKTINDVQREALRNIRTVLKPFISTRNFIQAIKNDLKYLNAVPHDVGFGISIGSRTHTNFDYCLWEKNWTLRKYNMYKPLTDSDLFYKNIHKDIHRIGSKWPSHSTSARNHNDIQTYDIVYKKRMQKLDNKIMEINTNIINIAKKYFTILKNNMIRARNLRILKIYFNKLRNNVKYNETIPATTINTISNIKNSLDCLIIHLNNLKQVIN